MKARSHKEKRLHEIQRYVEKRKVLYNALLQFLENLEDSSNDFQDLIDIIDTQHEIKSCEVFDHFLHLLTDIGNNYHRDDLLFQKLFQIIKYYEDQIKQTFSNLEIFNIFQSNKMILLYLFKNEIITVDNDIYIELMSKIEDNGYCYCHFFYPEIKKFIGGEKVKEIEEELNSKDQSIFDDFYKKREIGENESYICNLIRNDSIEEFIAFINRSNISLTSIINPSLFETNPFLIGKKPTLIEYAFFHGSIQVIRYLMMNKVKLEEHLWLYVIHSNNAELIHFLEEQNVELKRLYNKSLKEAIKCHHNNIADYIKENFNTDHHNNSKKTKKENEKVTSCILHYHNYLYFPTDFVFDYEIYYLCRFNYFKLVNLLMKRDKKEIEEVIKRLILINFFNDYEYAHEDKISFGINFKDYIKFPIKVMYFILLKTNKIDDYFLKYANECKIIAIPPSITSISDNSFEYYFLKNIVIPSSVTSIGKNAFYGCKSLKKIVIPSSITSIGENAFYNCKPLRKIIIPSSVKSIGKNAFHDSSLLSKIIIPFSLTSIEEGVFSKCDYVKSITIPSTIISIGKKAFFHCSDLKKINIPSSITSIEEGVFSGCYNLDNITIPSSVNSIRKNAFSDCRALKQITIPSSITSIEEGTFSGCSKLKRFTIPLSVTSIEEGAFSICSELERITIPSSVTSIKKNVFSYCKSLKQITIPSSITSIEEGTFSGCSKLESIELPSSLTSIGRKAFFYCESLKKITIPSSMHTIGKYAFAQCNSLEQISLCQSITKIDDYSFISCDSLVKISIPSSVISIGNFAFCKCKALKKISVPSSVTSIGCGAFSLCSSLVKIRIPSSVVSIGNCAFSECSSLTKITIPSSMTSIANCLFYKCTSLAKVTIPPSVTKIGIMAFCDCCSLVDIEISSSTTEIGELAFGGCSSLKELNSNLINKYKSFANIDDYNIKYVIEEGKNSAVFEAINKKTKQKFALKTYFKDYGFDFFQSSIVSTIPGFIKIQSFRCPLSKRRKKIVKTLKVTYNDEGKKKEVDLTGWIVISDYMKNDNISELTFDYLKKKGKIDYDKMNPTIRSKIIIGVASILKHAHKMGVIIRGLKMKKIFLDDYLEPVINPLSLSTFLVDPFNIDMDNESIIYIAPEVISNSYEFDHFAADVYSYAIILYKMFSNTIKFQGRNVESLTHHILCICNEKRPEKPDNIPEHYWELIQKCWKQEPYDRPTFEEITDILKDDKYALEEFGNKTNLQELHEYQQRIDTDNHSFLSKMTKYSPVAKKKKKILI